MAEMPTRDNKCRWDFDSLAVNVITWFVVLVIVAVGTGIGWCLGALGGKLLELLYVEEAVYNGGILGGAFGLCSALYILLRRPKGTPEQWEKERRMQRYGKIMALAASAGMGRQQVLQMKGLDPEIKELLLEAEKEAEAKRRKANEQNSEHSR
jgi:hypothetical protein